MRLTLPTLALLLTACRPLTAEPAGPDVSAQDSDLPDSDLPDSDLPDSGGDDARPPVAGEVRTITTALLEGDGLVLGADGALYVSEPKSNDIRRVTLDGEVSLLSDALSEPYGLSLGGDGWIYVANWGEPSVARVSPAGRVETFMHLDDKVGNVWVTPTGDLLVPYFYAQRIERVSTAGEVTVVAESDQFRSLHGVLLDEDGRLIAGNYRSGEIFVQGEDGEMAAWAQLPGQLGNLLLFQGVIYATGYDTHQIYQLSPAGELRWFAGGEAGDADGPASEARFEHPNGLVGDAERGVLYVSETSGRVREISLVSG